ncbi:MAG: thiamine pyrophosphate-dependent enzyme, partial [Deltaproteobacteria bacterium]|nr:thiamine pyrophosphate-dependent enzyme [Deltaproteobacteria bacterium]
MHSAAGELVSSLRSKSAWVREEALKIHKIAQDTRIASSLSCVEIFAALFYGRVLNFNPGDIKWEGRDRLIISKGHGAISLYPILADLGYFDKKELEKVCGQGTFLGGIPDPVIPGFETVNGSLGHGPGVGCGMAVALKRKGRGENIFVLIGDGELYEGSVWEAVMFAGGQRLDNLVLIIDNNGACMLDFCRNIIDLSPLDEKLRAFGWDVKAVDGHDPDELRFSLLDLKTQRKGRPKALIANTVKG